MKTANLINPFKPVYKRRANVSDPWILHNYLVNETKHPETINILVIIKTSNVNQHDLKTVTALISPIKLRLFIAHLY